MTTITNPNGAELSITLGDKGMVVTLHDRNGASVSEAFPLGQTTRFLLDFKEDVVKARRRWREMQSSVKSEG